jgi:CRISPR-associated endonuclease/helicase Cas3
LSRQHGETIKPLLIHSQALLQQMPKPTATVEESDKRGDRAAAEAWFLPRKKSLLAPFGVGTVDQALMSILQTKHFFVRLLGLSHKVVVFDEVHAYDAYMSVLFEHLLRWLRAVGASVIVLSATLSDQTRSRLLAAWGAPSSPTARYPRLTWVGARGRPQAIELPILETKKLAFDWMPREPEAIVQRLKAELRQGGCVAVICNTVKRAQRVYWAICDDEELKQCGSDNLILFHARFPLAWREGVEARVLGKFGPNSQDKRQPNPDRPQKAIVIATQVIEQSLDLDFDVMISDHAPADLLLQRAGRLHRHSANAATRRHPHRLLVALPEIVDGAPQFERSDVLVYEEFVLLRSWLALRTRTDRAICIPEDVAELIEQVYGDAVIPDVSSAMAAKLASAKNKMDATERTDQFDAKRQLIGKPKDEFLLLGENIGLEEDDPRVHKTFQALTRGDRPGINVVCLHRVEGRLCLEPDGAGRTYDPTAMPDSGLIRELARHSVTISRPDIEKYLLEPTEPEIVGILEHWKEIAALRYHRAAIFEDGLCKLPGSPYTLRLTRIYGLEILKEV